MRGVEIPQNVKESIAVQGGALIVYEDLILDEAAERIGCPMSSMYRWMMDFLPSINIFMYEQVRERLEEHKGCGNHENCEKYKDYALKNEERKRQKRQERMCNALIDKMSNNGQRYT